ncbi:MAG: hypothetical protein ACM3JD_16370 [Rudaea sp.]
MKQYQAVVEAMEQVGGYATFGKLYELAPNIAGSKWGTKTPFASIRRIVQERPEFFRIRPGLWGLSSQKQAILEKLSLKGAADEQVQAFDHTYYQGLVVEIGNLKRLATFVPNQDKNRKFLDKPLGTLATVKDIYPFTYENLMQRARTIDVTWFNERKMPHSFFEIEYSTDFNNSLLKFTELQDFNACFWITADQNRKKEYDAKLAAKSFKEIATRVKFLTYDTLSDWHARAYELSTIEKKLE